MKIIKKSDIISITENYAFLDELQDQRNSETGRGSGNHSIAGFGLRIADLLEFGGVLAIGKDIVQTQIAKCIGYWHGTEMGKDCVFCSNNPKSEIRIPQSNSFQFFDT